MFPQEVLVCVVSHQDQMDAVTSWPLSAEKVLVLDQEAWIRGVT